MSLVFAAIVPHSPVLIPSIGKENLSRMEATQNSYLKLADGLLRRRADTIIIISPHGVIQADTFTMNLSPQFSGNFEEFGDFSTKKTWPGDVGLTYKIREALETSASLQLISAENLDHGASVPLYLLTQKLSNIKIAPLYYSGLSYEAHFKFGQLLQHELLSEKTRIAVIASGDLSHRLSKDAPGGYSPKAKKFDKKIIDLIAENTLDKLVDIDPDLAAQAGECGLRSILILAGAISGIKHEPKVLSYEAPFGVGYLTANFVI
jgi:AmmeMemoRadiSam system protein B